MAVWNIRGVPKELARTVKMAAAARGITLTELVIGTMEQEVAESDSRKKIAEVSAGGAAQGDGGAPGLPPMGKAHLEGIFDGVKINIGLKAQGHFETVERMRGEGKSWDEIGEAIGWAGHAVQEWYKIEIPKFPHWTEDHLRKSLRMNRAG